MELLFSGLLSVFTHKFLLFSPYIGGFYHGLQCTFSRSAWHCRLLCLGRVRSVSGLPAFTIVGLPDAAVNEARERVRAAIKNCGFSFPVSRITVNLAPAM